MKKLTLDFDEPNGYSAIGISSQLADYKLLFHVNRILKLQFIRVENFEINNKYFSGNFSLYIHQDQNNRLDFFLMANKSDGKVLVSEFKQLDFLFIIEGEIDPVFISNITSKLRKIPQVLFTQEIDIEGIKNYSVLSEAFEMHLDRVMEEKNKG